MARLRLIWLDLLLLAIPGGALWLAMVMSFEIGKSSGLYPEIIDMASVLLLLSALGFVAILGIAARLIWRTLKSG